MEARVGRGRGPRYYREVYGGGGGTWMDMGSVGPRRDMGEELGRTGENNDDANDQHSGSPTQLTQE